VENNITTIKKCYISQLFSGLETDIADRYRFRIPRTVKIVENQKQIRKKPIPVIKTEIKIGKIQNR